MQRDTLIHIFKELLPQNGYHYRQEQAALAEHIYGSLSRCHLSMSEAGVGVGKTHAYLIAAALVKRSKINVTWIRPKYPDISYDLDMPIVVATSSIALQRAIIRDYIPEISDILLRDGIISRPLTGVIRKGRKHFVCEKRLRSYYAFAVPGKTELLEALLSGSKIDLAEADGLTEYDKRKINVQGQCDSSCSHRSLCRYIIYMDRAKTGAYDFQICNHNYYLADTLHRQNGKSPLIPHYQAVIIDEAHKFLDAARQMYGYGLSYDAVHELCGDIRELTLLPGQSTAALWRDREKLAGQARRLFRLLEQNIPELDTDEELQRLPTVIDQSAARHLKNVCNISNSLISTLELRTPMENHRGLYRRTLWELSELGRRAESLRKLDEIIYWLEESEDGGTHDLCAIPKELGENLYTDIWSRGIPTVLTSGTLAAGGSFSHLKRSLGMDRLLPHLQEETIKPSPFNYRNNALIYISENVPFPDNESTYYIQAVADELERLIFASHGHAAILFTSYRAMDKVYGLLKKRKLPFPLMRLDRGGASVINRFRASENAVLLASGSMWEGIDIPGDALSLLVIVRLPFAAPDPLREYERSLYGSMEEYKEQVIVPDMLVKLKQGFGRLIRLESDTGVVALLDSRAGEQGAYRGAVLGALPYCRVVSKMFDVREFLTRVKSPDYFEWRRTKNVSRQG